jgi:hypothetical protein
MAASGGSGGPDPFASEYMDTENPIYSGLFSETYLEVDPSAAYETVNTGAQSSLLNSHVEDLYGALSSPYAGALSKTIHFLAF